MKLKWRGREISRAFQSMVGAGMDASKAAGLMEAEFLVVSQSTLGGGCGRSHEGARLFTCEEDRTFRGSSSRQSGV